MTGTTGRRRLPPHAFANLKLPRVSLKLQRIIAQEANRRRDNAIRLRKEAQEEVEAAKAKVELLILGGESQT